jgi:hypothetical protein
MTEQYCIHCENEEFDDNKVEVVATSYGDWIFCDIDCLIAWQYGI